MLFQVILQLSLNMKRRSLYLSHFLRQTIQKNIDFFLAKCLSILSKRSSTRLVLFLRQLLDCVLLGKDFALILIDFLIYLVRHFPSDSFGIFVTIFSIKCFLLVLFGDLPRRVLIFISMPHCFIRVLLIVDQQFRSSFLHAAALLAHRFFYKIIISMPNRQQYQMKNIIRGKESFIESQNVGHRWRRQNSKYQRRAQVRQIFNLDQYYYQ